MVLLGEIARDARGRLRAEAAVLLARLAPAQAEEPAREALRDRDPQARALGLLALGHAAPPGAEVLIGHAFEEADDGGTDQVAAAYALGLLPDPQPVPALDRYIARVDGGNYRRHRDRLASVLLGLGETPHPSRRASLQRLLEDAANRDGGLRALAIRALGRAGDAPDAEELDERLDAEWPEVRLATLDELAGDAARVAEYADRLARTARRDDDPRVRARALRLLVEARQGQAFGLADAALRARDSDGVAAGVAATTELGGGELRGELVEKITTERNGERKAAMFGAWHGSVPDELADAALAFATDHRRSPQQRALAIHLLAREGDERAIPLLRAVLAESDDGATVALLVDDLHRLGADGDLADRLGDDDASALDKLAPRLEALFRLGRPEAVEILRAALEDDRLGDTARAELLRAWRRAVAPPPPDEVLSVVPERLRELLR